MSVLNRPKVRDVTTTAETTTDPYNAAIAAILRAQKAELRATFPELETATGIKLRKLKALFNDEVSIRMGDFILLTAALKLQPAAVIQTAAARVEKTTA